MIVSSTEFQQRVGYYLSLVAQGTEVIIEKKKPGRTLYTLSLSDESPRKKRKSNAELLKELQKKNYRFPYSDGVKFQRSVRR